jgi:hypothetical protein
LFASRTISGHLARGALGGGTMAFALSEAGAHPWLPLAALPIALVALRGCPTCWTIGLVQTVVAKLQGKSTEGRCLDGSCGLDAERQNTHHRPGTLAQKIQ